MYAIRSYYDTAYDLLLESLAPRSLTAHIYRARLEDLLYLGGQPGFATGELNLDVKFASLSPDALKGSSYNFV